MCIRDRYTNLLDCHLQIFLKDHRILNMPPIEAALGHLIVVVVIIMQEGIVMGIVRIAQKRRAEGIFHCAAAVSYTHLKTEEE